MTTTEATSGDVLAWLLERAHELPPPAIGNLVAEALARVGVSSSCLFLADHDQRWLHPFGPDRAEHESQPVDGTIAGRCFALESTVTVPAADGTRVWMPLIDGTARLGVLVVEVDAGAAHQAVVAVQRVASLAAELLISKSRYTDAVEQARRRKPMTLVAEMQRSSLPPNALITREVAVAGILLPAYEVAGDSFDYALNDDRLDVSMIDSVGHDLTSATVSHLVSSALRNSRRNGLDLDDAYRAADEAIRHVFTGIQFATAAFGHLELRTGRFRWVAAGHPPPLLVRSGRVVGEAPTKPIVPLGLSARTIVVNEVALEAGDALLLYTDGVTEGGARGSERFGLDRLVDLLGRELLAGLPLAELVRRLASAVLKHTAYELHDDTALLLVEYRSPPPGDPATDAESQL